MGSTAQEYEEAKQALDAVLDAFPAGCWSAPSPCEGWAARDVIRHMVETQRAFLTGRGLDVGTASDLDADPVAAWRNHAERVIELLRDDGVVATGYDGYFGPTTVGATLEQFYVWDMLVHRWDVATSADLDAGLTDAELDRIEQGADSFGEGLHMEGICKPGVEAVATTTGRSGCSPASAGAPDTSDCPTRPSLVPVARRASSGAVTRPG